VSDRNNVFTFGESEYSRTTELSSPTISMAQKTEVRRLDRFRLNRPTAFCLVSGQERWVVLSRLGSILKSSSLGGISPKRPLIPEWVLHDWTRQRSFDNISQTTSGQFGLAKFAL